MEGLSQALLFCKGFSNSRVLSIICIWYKQVFPLPVVFEHLMVYVCGMKSLVSSKQFQKESEQRWCFGAQNTPESSRNSTIFVSEVIHLLFYKRTRGKVLQVKH